ncbi:MAG: CHRD domain-containing protein [Balneolaceae bacterium]|nr:CHRD domain-containing protein [Balneolaceae bacterium]
MKAIMLFLAAILMAFVVTGCSDSAIPSTSQSDVEISSQAGSDLESRNAASANNRNFRANLNGDNEVPPADTRARGQATFQLSKDGTAIHYKLIVANIENVTMAHIHVGVAGVNGPVVAWLYPSAPPPALIPGRTNGILAEGEITASNLVGQLAGEPLEALLELMRSGGVYVNVHTSQFPGGEVRGQIF